ncbi:hypothetical protein ACIA9I_34360 [Streptomyces anulatus]
MRTELTCWRDDGGALTDGDCAAMERLPAAYRRTGTPAATTATGQGW